jgi:hypothetical protein
MRKRGAHDRSLFGPLQRILSIGRVPFGQGHKMVLRLACGHVVEHLQRNDLRVGGRTGCDKCR